MSHSTHADRNPVRGTGGSAPEETGKLPPLVQIRMQVLAAKGGAGLGQRRLEQPQVANALASPVPLDLVAVNFQDVVERLLGAWDGHGIVPPQSPSAMGHPRDTISNSSGDETSINVRPLSQATSI